jgi:hypothetical protein
MTEPTPKESEPNAAPKAAKVPKHRTRLSNALHLLSSIMSILGFSYLVIDLRFQTAPSISSPASDPGNPFRFPFSFTNNSHLFSVYNVSWTCHLEKMVLSGDAPVPTAKEPRVMMAAGSASILLPGNILNLDCSRAFSTHGARIQELAMSINTTYTMYTLGLLPSTAKQSTSFRWYPEAANPQWIKGQDAE